MSIHERLFRKCGEEEVLCLLQPDGEHILYLPGQTISYKADQHVVSIPRKGQIICHAGAGNVKDNEGNPRGISLYVSCRVISPARFVRCCGEDLICEDVKHCIVLALRQQVAESLAWGLKEWKAPFTRAKAGALADMIMDSCRDRLLQLGIETDVIRVEGVGVERMCQA